MRAVDLANDVVERHARALSQVGFQHRINATFGHCGPGEFYNQVLQDDAPGGVLFKKLFEHYMYGTAPAAPKVSAKVKWVNRGGGLGLTTPMKTDSAKAFAAKMRGEVLAASKNIQPAKPSSHPNAPGNNQREPGSDDDEIGF